jgi:argininosuccinate lyase
MYLEASGAEGFPRVCYGLMRKLWGGAFASGTDELVDSFGQSIDSDLLFWREDVTGSIAHARMLGDTGILPKADAARLIEGLQEILEEGPDKLPTDVEDIHTAVEVRLREIVGDVAGKLHTARSRNDQVATDTRLYLRRRLADMDGHFRELQETLIALGEQHLYAVMPGYTHQQRAQPITLGFHLMAYFWAFDRHRRRVAHVREMASQNPLGSAALSGTGFPIDRWQTTHELGFTEPSASALDATSDRAYLLDALHLCALAMIDLSRLSQELILFSTKEFGFVRLHDSVTTGSSIMPQKRNPDMAELIRGRSARALANWNLLAGVMKALPMGYNRDTQEDKPPLFDSLDLVADSTRLVRQMLATATWQTERMAAAVRGDFSTATDLADFLASQGMPFREAHEVVGKAVRYCEARGIGLEDLNAFMLEEAAPGTPTKALEVLSPEGSVARRNSFGGPAPEAMREQLRLARERL